MFDRMPLMMMMVVVMMMVMHHRSRRGVWRRRSGCGRSGWRCVVSKRESGG
jgi:hypothetical protein